MNASPGAVDVEDAPGRPLLQLRQISKRWGDRTVLDDARLDAEAGIVTHIVGGNGTGKTTLLRIATGIILPDTGTVSFRGVDIEDQHADYRRAVGFLSAGDRGLYARLTAEQNLEFWAGLAGFRRQERRRRIAAALDRFEAGEFADRRVDRLSLGQRQRIRLAMTFLPDPSILILDEPTTSLDEPGIAVLESAVAETLAAGGAIVWAAPRVETSCRYSAWTLVDGELRPDGADDRSTPTLSR